LILDNLTWSWPWLGCREVGYCQGSAFIVGLLLMQMPEEESFAVLVRIMQDYRMREMFKPSMAELGLCMYQAGQDTWPIVWEKGEGVEKKGES
jgi:hypothetical protein